MPWLVIGLLTSRVKAPMPHTVPDPLTTLLFHQDHWKQDMHPTVSFSRVATWATHWPGPSTGLVPHTQSGVSSSLTGSQGAEAQNQLSSLEEFPEE